MTRGILSGTSVEGLHVEERALHTSLLIFSHYETKSYYHGLVAMHAAFSLPGDKSQHASTSSILSCKPYISALLDFLCEPENSSNI